jgi:hypothetical protein
MINENTRVTEILKTRKSQIKRAPLPPGAPSWDEIAELTWGDIVEGARQNRPGFRTIRKLLTDKEYER